MFPNAACVVSLIVRLVHRCAIVPIEAESYLLKKAVARTEQKAAARPMSKSPQDHRAAKLHVATRPLTADRPLCPSPSANTVSYSSSTFISKPSNASRNIAGV